LSFLPSVLIGQETDSFKVARVVDGDTLLLSTGERVRLLGVDTPEFYYSRKLFADSRQTGQDVQTIRQLGKRASAFVKRLVENREVTLQFDPINARKNHRDRYGRLLAYVFFKPVKYEKIPYWLPRDVYYSDLYKQGFLNGLIVYAGFGSAYTQYPFEFMDQFRGYAKSARVAARGLWKEE